MSGVLSVLLSPGGGAGGGGGGTWLGIAMTADSDSGYVASADSENASFAFTAFDHTAAARPYPNVWHADQHDMSITPHWLQLQFPSTVQVNSYTLWKRSDDFTYSPSNFALMGSNDGSSWTTYDTRTTGFDTAYWTANDSSGVLTVTGSASHAYWRLNITDTAGAAPAQYGYTYLSQLQLFS